MQILIVELTYKKPLLVVDQFLAEHRAFLQKYYDAGLLLISGPKDPRTGGIIIALTDQKTMQNIIKEDPFYQHEIADYHYLSFEAVKYCKELQFLLKG